MRINKSTSKYGCKNVNTNIDQFVPKYVIRQQVRLVLDFSFFAIFYGFKKTKRVST